MNCPYCAEEIKLEATLCGSCRSDLRPILPLVSAIETMNKRIDELLDRLEPEPGRVESEAPPVALARSARDLLVFDAKVIGTLAVVYALISIFVMINWPDSSAPLRTVTLLVPFIFGFYHAREAPERGRAEGALAVIASIGCVFVLSATSSLAFDFPFAIKDAKEMMELVNFATCVGLAYVSGVLVARALDRAELKTRLATAGFKSEGVPKGAKALKAKIDSVNTVLISIMAAITAIASACTGFFKAFN